jgi:hypothetical protein
MAALLRARPPGILSLVAVLRAHGEALEADLIDRGLDLRDLWRPGGSVTWRRLGVIYRHLPPESATMTALRNATPATVLERHVEDVDPATGRWSQSQMLAASQLDTLRLILHVLLTVNGARPGDAPKPTARPGVAGAKKRKRLTAEQRRMLDPRMRQTSEGG